MLHLKVSNDDTILKSKTNKQIQVYEEGTSVRKHPLMILCHEQILLRSYLTLSFLSPIFNTIKAKTR